MKTFWHLPRIIIKNNFMELLGWIATILSITGIVLNAKKIIYCWPIWLVSNILWIIYNIQLKELSPIVLWVVFFMFNIYGWIEWNKSKYKNKK